jgi:hypothetical protein
MSVKKLSHLFFLRTIVLVTELGGLFSAWKRVSIFNLDYNKAGNQRERQAENTAPNIAIESRIQDISHHAAHWCAKKARCARNAPNLRNWVLCHLQLRMFLESGIQSLSEISN